MQKKIHLQFDDILNQFLQLMQQKKMKMKKNGYRERSSDILLLILNALQFDNY